MTGIKATIKYPWDKYCSCHQNVTHARYSPRSHTQRHVLGPDSHGRMTQDLDKNKTISDANIYYCESTTASYAWREKRSNFFEQMKMNNSYTPWVWCLYSPCIERITLICFGAVAHYLYIYRLFKPEDFGWQHLNDRWQVNLRAFIFSILLSPLWNILPWYLNNKIPLILLPFL